MKYISKINTGDIIFGNLPVRPCFAKAFREGKQAGLRKISPRSFRISLFICTLFLLMKGNAYSQNLVWPSGIRIGTDLSRAGISLVSPARDQIEINADIDLYKYFLTVDYGYWDTDLSADDRHYSMNGSYFRAGFDYNFLFYDEDRHVMFFGFRYGRTGFDEAYEFNIQDPIYGTGLIRGEKTGSSAGWMEVCTGMKVRIAGQLYLGWTGRLKFGLDMDAPGEFTTYEIPGYGKTAKTTSWGLNYSIYYRIVFRNKPPIPRKSAK